MAISDINAVVMMVRNLLKDVAGAHFYETEIKSQLYNSVQIVNIRLGAGYEVGEDTTLGTVFTTAPTSNKHRFIIALQCAVDLVAAEYSMDTYSGEGGISFKSGLSSYDSTGRSVSYRDDLKRRSNLLEILYTNQSVLDANTGGIEIDLYATTIATLEAVL